MMNHVFNYAHQNHTLVRLLLPILCSLSLAMAAHVSARATGTMSLASLSAANQAGGSSVIASRSDCEARLSAAIELYRHQKIRAAAERLHSVLEANPRSARARYYYGNCLSKMQLPRKAAKEYRACYFLTRSDQLKGYCLSAIQACNRAVRALQSKSRSDVQSPSTGCDHSANYKKQALALMQTQAERASRSAERAYKGRADADIERGERRVVDLQREADSVMGIMRTSWERNLITGELMPVYSPQEVAHMEKYYKRQIAAVREEAEQAAQVEKLRARAYQEKIEQELLSLKGQLEAPSGTPGTPQLQAIGTSMYVRMYATPDFVPHPVPQEELAATQEKLILDQHSRRGAKKYRVVPAQMIADQSKLNMDNHMQKNITRLQVSGRLLQTQ